MLILLIFSKVAQWITSRVKIHRVLTTQANQTLNSSTAFQEVLDGGVAASADEPVPAPPAATEATVISSDWGIYFSIASEKLKWK